MNTNTKNTSQLRNQPQVQIGEEEIQELLTGNESLTPNLPIEKGSKKNYEAWFVDESGRVVKTPEDHDEQSASGHMPDLETDDEILEASHDVGIRLDEGYENPKELNIAKEVERAEKRRRGL